MSDDVAELPNGWTSIQLKQFLIKGAGSVNPIAFPDEVFELFSIPAYDQGKPELVQGKGIGSTKKIVREADVLISRIVPHIKRSWVVPKAKGRRQIGSGEWIIFHGDSFLPAYMRYFLISPCFHQKFMKTISGVGGSLTRANPDQVAEFLLPLPPLAEQERIVAKIEELLSSLDKGIENLKTVQEQLKIFHQAVLKQAFEGKLTNKNVNNGEMPRGWQWVRICDVAEVSGGITKNAKRESNNKYPYLRVANVYQNRLDLAEIETIGASENEVSRCILKRGDLLFVEGNGSIDQIGRAAIWTGEIENCIHQNHIIKARPNTGASDKYILYFFCSQLGRNEIKQVASSTSGLYTLSISKIKGLKLPYCSTSEQKQVVTEIESRLSICDKLVESIDQGLLQAEALRQSILKKAFEGKLVHQDPKDEPASILIERIRAERDVKRDQVTAVKTRTRKAKGTK